MYLLGIGVLLLALKVMEIDPITNLSWWWVALPYALAVLWWGWADATGYTRRKAMERENARKQARIEKNREALGLTPRQKRR